MGQFSMEIMPLPGSLLSGNQHTGSPRLCRWLTPENRCLAPLTSFAEPVGKGNAWFKLAGDRPAMFAGLWAPDWTSIRKLKDGETTDELYGFLTTEPNAEVAEIHPKAMPVILTDPADWETWLTAAWAEAKALQRPLPDGSLVREYLNLTESWRGWMGKRLHP